MFLGHFAVGLAAKRAAPRASLGALFMASQFIDLLWPLLLLSGIEGVRIDPGNTVVTPLDLYHYPWSHSLLMVLFWAAGFGAVYWLLRRYPRGALVSALVLVSHWLLDFISHRPDLPLAPGLAQNYGLGLWNSLPATAAVELGLFAFGLWLYLNTTRPVNRRGKYSIRILALVLVGIMAANWLGPPPPDVRTLALSALGIWLFVLWGFWADSNRRVVSGVR